jgi:hypothetical protein
MHPAGQRIAGREDIGEPDRMNPASRKIGDESADQVAGYITNFVAVVPESGAHAV